MSDEIHEEVRDANRSLRELGVSCDWQGKIDRAAKLWSDMKREQQKADRAEIEAEAKGDMSLEQSRLREHSAMLGQIAGLVAEFCESNTTTLDGVKLMQAELYELRAEQLRQEAGWE